MVLVTLTDRSSKQKQCLLYTEVTTAPATNEHGGFVIYNSFGHKFEFPSMPAAVKSRTIGPFALPPKSGHALKIQDESTRFDLNA